MPKEHIIAAFLFFLFTIPCILKPVYAIIDPFSVPNNRFGIHLIQSTPDESFPAAELVNHSGGDWGYVTVLVESTDRNRNKWQNFFNDLRRQHLIPLIRLATQPEDNHWKLPYDGEEQAWADFLDALNWPTKNRYIIIYNEPNQAKEWGNKVDAKSYAETLDKVITALKNKNRDFFVLNAGFDASAPAQPPQYEDERTFMQKMNETVPGIFNKLDGWVSHSYPNPGFTGSPDGIGKGTITTWAWELQQLRDLGVTKNLPLFITETGWKHAEGLSYDFRLPTADTISQYYQQAFQNAWNNNQIVAITPFLLNYQEVPFDHFSFKRPSKEKISETVLGTDSPDPSPQYYPIYQTIQKLPKVAGKPIQQIQAKLTAGEIYSSIVAGEAYTILLTFKNIGQSIWNDRDMVKLLPIFGGQNLGITGTGIPKNIKVEPEQEYTFKLNLKAPESGTYQVALNLFDGGQQFDSDAIQFTTQVKAPVVLKIMSALGWKKDFAGDYTLKVKGINGENIQSINLNSQGVSDEIEAKYLLPDYTFEFSLEKPFYITQTLNKKVYTGINTLDFGILKPDLFLALLDPAEFWKLLPFSK